MKSRTKYINPNLLRGLACVPLLMAPSVEAIPITHSFTNANLTLNIVSDVNDWQWEFTLNWTGNADDTKKITSLHLSWLEGDVRDEWEYEDYQSTDGWRLLGRNQDTGALGWDSLGGVALGGETTDGVNVEINDQVKISFDSDYYYDPNRTYRIALDYSDQSWETVILHDHTIEKLVPATGTLFIFAAGLAGLTLVQRGKLVNRKRSQLS